MVLETISVDKPTTKSIFVLIPDGNNTTYKVGRANDQDLRMQDISSSRAHAVISFDGK
jgi:pSer/pThr/pTyr-binding forkhead associated (FHA) protein